MPDADATEVLRILPERWHEQFLAEHAAFLRGWHLRAIAYSDPGFEAAMHEAADPDAELTDITPLLEAHREWVAAERPGETSQGEAAVLLLGRRNQRAERDVGRVASHPARLSGQPVFEGTRIRVSTVQGYLRSGRDTSIILEAFPDLQEADVDLAKRLL